MIPDKMFCSKMCPLPTVSCGTMKLTFMFDIFRQDVSHAQHIKINVDREDRNEGMIEAKTIIFY